MVVALTEKEFSQHLNTSFQLKLDDQKVELELVEVKGYLSQAQEQTGMERFSVFFDGPGRMAFATKPSLTTGQNHLR